MATDLSDEFGLVGYGSGISQQELLEGYRVGVFPMPIESGYGWFCPPIRAGVDLREPLPVSVSRSVRQLLPRYHVVVDGAPDEMIAACADVSRPGGWISPTLVALYHGLSCEGYLHSIEVRDGAGKLVGGLFGVAVGGLFSGESMMYRVANASKLAFAALVVLAQRIGLEWIDGQWMTPHLKSVGFCSVERTIYLAQLPRIVGRATPSFGRGHLDLDREDLRALSGARR
ncbi:MAG: leucyl/phenylalanyl-tRNA--protein transferase [Ferrimicrobium sp.]